MWQPQPIDTSGICLPEHLRELRNTLYRHAHDVWAGKRIAEGWRHGPHRDDTRRLHPDLVAYDDLTDDEKSYDRDLIDETLRLAIKLGYSIEQRTPPVTEQGDATCTGHR